MRFAETGSTSCIFACVIEGFIHSFIFGLNACCAEWVTREFEFEN
jgi:hypothetical protein